MNPDGRVPSRVVDDVRHRELAPRAVDVESKPGRHRVPAVGDHPDIEMIDRHRLRGVDLGPLPPHLVEGRLPGRGRIVVERSAASTRQAPGHECARRDAPARRDVARPQRVLDRGVGRFSAHGRIAGQVEGARGRKRELSSDRQLGLIARRHRPGRVSTHDEGQGMVAGRRSERIEQVARHLHDLMEPDVVSRVRVAQADLGEADGIGLTEQVRPVVVHLDDADRERVERPTRERDRLSRSGARAAVEDHVHRSSAVERQHGVRDVAVAPAVDRLHEVDVVGSDLAVEIDLDALAARVSERLGAPRGGGIAVERGARPILGPVRVRVAERGRGHSLHADVAGRRQRRRLLTREHVEARVAGIGGERSICGVLLLGEPEGLVHARPSPRPQAVVVGDDQHVGGGSRAAQQRRSRVRRGVTHDPRAIEEAHAGGIDQTFAVAAHHEPVVDRLRAYDPGRIRDRIPLDRRDRRRARGRHEADLVVVSRRQGKLRRRSITGRSTEPRRDREHCGEVLGPHEVVPLVLDVVARYDVADAHPSPQRDQSARIGDAHLQPAIDRVQEIGSAGCPVRDELARDVRPVGKPGCDRIDRVAPRVRGEVGAGLFEDAGLVVAAVECGDRLRPVRRHLLRALEVLAVERPVDERREVHEDQHTDERGHGVRERHLSARLQPAEHRVRGQSEEYGEREDDQWSRPPGAAKCETGGRRVRERLEQTTERRGARVGMRADRDDDADEQQQHEEGAVAPARESGGEEGEHDEAVARQDHIRVLRVVVRSLDPRPEPVLAVEEPVAEAAQDLVGCRRQRDGLDGLAVLQHVEAVSTLHAQTGDPPQ